MSACPGTIVLLAPNYLEVEGLAKAKSGCQQFGLAGTYYFLKILSLKSVKKNSRLRVEPRTFRVGANTTTKAMLVLVTIRLFNTLLPNIVCKFTIFL